MSYALIRVSVDVAHLRQSRENLFLSYAKKQQQNICTDQNVRSRSLVSTLTIRSLNIQIAIRASFKFIAKHGS